MGRRHRRNRHEMEWVTSPTYSGSPREALRLHPPTPLMLPHRANADVKLAGCDVPKGSNVLVNVWAIARNPAVWNLLEFRPERFADEDVDMKGHDFRLLPFGAGRRVCPGAQLGINMVQSMLGHLLHQFRWERRTRIISQPAPFFSLSAVSSLSSPATSIASRRAACLRQTLTSLNDLTKINRIVHGPAAGLLTNSTLSQPLIDSETKVPVAPW
ncbi:hypothetical protein Taro_024308 [Colocasia esculenta]|uniref:Uncharacterized protein n=1 Tax=Colocasia esculenta TaxID=4460 RepID=A0A843VJZ0_COLES|nr:hypothetical protein [Colocasia esculenta]